MALNLTEPKLEQYSTRLVEDRKVMYVAIDWAIRETVWQA